MIADVSFAKEQRGTDLTQSFMHRFQLELGYLYNVHADYSVSFNENITVEKFREIFSDIITKYGFDRNYTQANSGFYSSRHPEGQKEIDKLYLSGTFLFSRTSNLGLAISTAYNMLTIQFAYSEEHAKVSVVEDFHKDLIQFLLKNETCEPKKSKVHFICESKISGLYLKEFKMDGVKDDKELVDFDLENHYNDSFTPVCETVLSALNGTGKSKGIIMLHGFNGTGKTNFLRYVISAIDRKVIYITPDMSARLSDPAFLAFLMDHKDSVLIIEDAENVLKSREAGQNQAVSNLLNVTDGILGDSLRFQVICTFNTSYDQIDHALKRPGRLIAEYEFTRLDEKKTTALVKKLYGEDAEPTEKLMSLGEIFNMNTQSEFSDANRVQKQTIGFVR